MLAAFAFAVLALLCSTGAHAAGRVFYDGFESGNTNLWSQADWHNRCTVVSSSSDGITGPDAGSQMLRCNWNGTVAWNTPAHFESLTLDTLNYNNEVFIRFRMRIDNNLDRTDTSPAKMPRIYTQDVTSNDMYGVIWIGGGLRNEGVAANDPLVTYWGGSDNIGSTASWHEVEWYINQLTGKIKVWHDGTLVRDDTKSIAAGRWEPFFITSNWSDTHDATNYAYFDEFEIFSDTGTGGSGLMSDSTMTQGGGGDTTAPTGVAITVPSNGATVSGNQTVTATCTDETAVANVQMLLDGSNLGTADTSSPYSITWDTTGASNASHTLSARCTDTSANQTTSGTISVTVANGSPPVASFSCSPLVLQAPAASTCTGSGTNSPTAWAWNCGNATSCATQNCVCTYQFGGRYTVTLTATNGSGSDDEVKSNYLTVRARKPVGPH